MTEAMLIAKSNFDLNNLFRAGSQVLHRLLTKAIDRASPEPGEAVKAISAIQEFALDYASGTVVENTRNADFELFFLHYTFMCRASEGVCQEIRDRTKLDVCQAEGGDLFLVAGTLAEWKRAVAICCSEKALQHTRLLFDKILLHFEREGVGQVWFDYKKKMLPDKTFLLTYDP